MNKQITLSLGGKEWDLDFGTMGFYKYIKEVTKKEPFDWLTGFDTRRSKNEDGSYLLLFLEDISTLVYAGLNCKIDAEDKENVPYEKVVKWCNGLSTEVITQLVTAAFSVEEKETGEAQTQEPKS